MNIVFEILSAAINSGLFATLFCFLFIHQLKDSREREKKFVRTIEALLSGLKTIDVVDEKCAHIKDEVRLVREDCKEIKETNKGIKRSINKGMRHREIIGVYPPEERKNHEF